MYGICCQDDGVVIRLVVHMVEIFLLYLGEDKTVHEVTECDRRTDRHTHIHRVIDLRPVALKIVHIPSEISRDINVCPVFSMYRVSHNICPSFNRP